MVACCKGGGGGKKTDVSDTLKYELFSSPGPALTEAHRSEIPPSWSSKHKIYNIRER